MAAHAIRLCMRTVGHPGLRQRSLPVVWNKMPTGLVEEMMSFLRVENDQYKTSGLSAPQVGNNLRMFVMLSPRGHFEAVLNPIILKASDKRTVGLEGCTSIPGVAAFVERPFDVEVEYTNRYGRQIKKDLTGQWSRTFQHELDHLDGVLMLDRVTNRDLMPIDELLQEMKNSRSKIWQRISPENRP